MKLIKAPQEYLVADCEIPCFMAGGLQLCDWHDEFLSFFQEPDYPASNLVIYNPRRDNFDLSDSNMICEQIKWEFKYLNVYLNRPYIFSMYFDDSKSSQPICFYELGRYLALLEKCEWDSVVISCHPNFSRKLDVMMQTKLATKGKMRVHELSPREHAAEVYKMYRYIKKRLT